MNSVKGLRGLLPYFYCRWSAWRLITLMTVCLMTMVVLGCKDRNKQQTAHWDRIVEGQNNELYFIDRNVIERVSDEIVRVPLKYAPAKGRFLVSLQELSKEFGTEVQDLGQEYTVSVWEFNCAKPEEDVSVYPTSRRARKSHPTSTPINPGPRWIRRPVRRCCVTLFARRYCRQRNSISRFCPDL